MSGTGTVPAAAAAGAPFGHAADGQPVRLHVLDDGHGTVARISDLGATLVGLTTPDRDGASGDVVLGFDDADGYRSDANQYHGATIGRVANRIGGASFDLGGHHYQLAANEGGHHLHGGRERSFDQVCWDVVGLGPDAIELRYVSPDGEEGYPGRVEAFATYRVSGGELTVEYRATTDQPTPINMTNHAYFNLAGAGRGTILDHELTIQAQAYTPADDDLIPTGELAEVAGTPLDFREPHGIGARIDELTGTAALGYDHNLVLDGPVGELRFAARVRDPESGRVLELHTDQPAVQFYSGNRLTGAPGKGGRPYEQFGGLCLEPQHHPDALHHPSFPSIVLDPGGAYEHRSVYRFTSDAQD